MHSAQVLAFAYARGSNVHVVAAVWFVCEPSVNKESAMSDAVVASASTAPASEATGQALSERDVEILDFEREWWKYAGAKEQAVRERFDVSPTRYYQLLNRVIDDEAAVAYDPMLVKRLRRLRAQRQRQRAARRLSADAGR